MMPQPLSTVHLQLLGDFEVRLDGRPVPLHRSIQRLVAYVALHERAAHRSRVAEALWPDLAAAPGLGRVRDVLYKIKPALPDLLEADAQRVRLHPATTLDIERARDVSKRVQHRADDAIARSDCVGKAREPGLVQLFGADLLPGWDEEWLVDDQQSFLMRRLRTLERLAQAFLAARRFAEAEEACRAVIKTEPYRETAHLLLAEVYRTEGNSAQALHSLRDFQRRLQTDLGLGATDPIRQFVRSIRAGAGSVDAAAAASTTSSSAASGGALGSAGLRTARRPVRAVS